MRIFSNYYFIIFLGMTILSACSRPVAYFQPTAHPQPAMQPQTSSNGSQEAAAELSPKLTSPTESRSASTEAVIQTKQTLTQLEAYVRNEAKPGANRKVVSRLARLNQALAAVPDQSLASAQANAKKHTFMERILLKKLNKKIKQQLAPEQAKAMNANIRLGIIIGIIGLVLLIIGGGVLTALGIIGLVVGIVLIVLGYLNS